MTTLATNLVSVGGTLVRGHRDDGRRLGVGHIVDSEGILVVGVADVAADVLLVGALVNKALSLGKRVVSYYTLGSSFMPGRQSQGWPNSEQWLRAQA